MEKHSKLHNNTNFLWCQDRCLQLREHCFVAHVSVLIGILEKLPLDPNEDDNNAGDHCTEVQMRVAAVDAMAEVKCPETNLNGSKTVRIFEKFSENEEIPLVSDRYDLPSSLKETTRTKKQKSQNPVYYRITASTHIAKVPMKRLQSHTKTKMELAHYIAQKTIKCGRRNGRRVVVAWNSECIGIIEDCSYILSNQEEADANYFTCRRCYSQRYHWRTLFLSLVQVGTIEKLFFDQFFAP